MRKSYVFIIFCDVMIITYLYSQGDRMMYNGAIIAAIISANAALIIDILTNVRFSKKVISFLENTIGKKNETTLQYAIDSKHEDLAKDHDDIIKILHENNKDQYHLIDSQTKLINEMNIRDIKEKAVREEREKHLSPEMLEIKKVSEAFQAMEKQMEDLKLQNDKLIAKIETVTNEKNLAENQHKEMMDDLNNMSTEELLRFFNRDTNDLNIGNDQKRGGGRGR